MTGRMALCIRLNAHQTAVLSALALAEGRTVSGLIKYAAMQYSQAHMERVDPKTIFTKFRALYKDGVKK